MDGANFNFSVSIADKGVLLTLVCPDLLDKKNQPYIDNVLIPKFPALLRIRVALRKRQMLRRLRKMKKIYAKHNT